jgi:hypothetical protein
MEPPGLRVYSTAAISSSSLALRSPQYLPSEELQLEEPGRRRSASVATYSGVAKRPGKRWR